MVWEQRLHQVNYAYANSLQCHTQWLMKWFHYEIDPRLDKTNKMICAPSEDSEQPGNPPSLIRVSAVRLKQNWVLSYPPCAQDSDQAGRMPRPIWVFAGQKRHFVGLSWGGSKCFFLESIYAAHILFITFFTFRIEPNMKSFSHANNIVLGRDIYNSLNWC